jgi:hypothetical protein
VTWGSRAIPVATAMALMLAFSVLASWGGDSHTRAGVVASPMPAAEVAALEDSHITVSPLSETESVAVAAPDAEATASKTLPLTAGSPASVALVEYTNYDFGPLDEKTGIVTPLFVKREAWAVSYTDVDVPLSGPPPAGGEKALRSATYRAILVVFIDANSGEYLSAIAYADN